MKSFILPLLLIGQLAVVAQWQKMPEITTANFRAISVTSKNIWLPASNGTFLKTDEKGEWKALPVEKGVELDFRDIHAIDDKTAIIVSAGEAEKGSAKIYRTSDGGISWKIVYQTMQKGVFLDAIDFWDKQNGIVLSDPINGRFFMLKTSDGGKTWKQINPEFIAPIQEGEAAFAASGTSLVTVGKNRAFFCTGGGKYARVYRTTNQGNTWVAVKTPMPAGKTNGLFGLNFWDENHGIAIGGDYQEITKGGLNVLLTSNGGKSWALVSETQPIGFKECVTVFNKKILIAVGPSGTCFSKDFGKTWKEIDRTPFHAIAVFKNEIWAVGAKGNIAKFTGKL
jgi:photosystem II stability/assembly factor-like uncharacterized protein